MQPKYIAKQKVVISDFVSISKYFYNWGVRIYIVDSRREEPLVVNIHHIEIDRALKAYKASEAG